MKERQWSQVNALLPHYILVRTLLFFVLNYILIYFCSKCYTVFSILHVGRIKSLHVVRKRNFVQQQVKYIPEPNVSLS